MDPKYAGETLRHLEKEGELLLNAHKAMSEELYRFQIEEEMLMHKFYELMSAYGLTKEVLCFLRALIFLRKGFNDNADDRQNFPEGADEMQRMFKEP